MKRGHVPIRTCRSCRRKAPKHELSRFVLEHGRLVDDDQGRGYGFYCCPRNACRTMIDKKLRKQKIVRADKDEDGSN
ncbi:MAG TPA: DUF448 domain-containing protein [Desulfobacteraceae bacterium]|nr:DUF448 domain-containing protein [Desulfobacteraceae bacterium]